MGPYADPPRYPIPWGHGIRYGPPSRSNPEILQNRAKLPRSESPTVSDLVLKTKSDTVGVSDPGPFGKFKGQSDMTRYAAASNIPDRGPYRILKGEGSAARKQIILNAQRAQNRTVVKKTQFQKISRFGKYEISDPEKKALPSNTNAIQSHPFVI